MDGRPTTMHSHLNVCTLVPRKIKEEVEAAIADAVAKDAAALPAAVAKVAGSHRAKKQRTSTTSSSQRSVIECFSTSSKVSADLDQRMLPLLPGLHIRCCTAPDLRARGCVCLCVVGGRGVRSDEHARVRQRVCCMHVMLNAMQHLCCAP